MSHAGADDIHTASAASLRPLLPPELVENRRIHTGSLRARVSNKDSILRHLHRPGHLDGEGIRRIYIGHHPEDDANGDCSSRSFLVGVEALWAEQEQEQHCRLKELKASRPTGDNSRKSSAGIAVYHDAQSRQNTGKSVEHLQNGHVKEPTPPAPEGQKDATLRKAKSWIPWRRRKESTDDEASSSSSSSSSEASDDDRESEDEGSAGPPEAESTQKVHETRPRKTSSPDELFGKLRSGDNLRHLSDGSEIVKDSSKEGLPIGTVAGITSRAPRYSPTSLSTRTDAVEPSFRTAQAFIASDGTRAVNKPVSAEIRKAVQDLANYADDDGLSTPLLEQRHTLTRHQSDTLLPETASDTAVQISSRPVLRPGKSTKSVRWDMSKKNKTLPVPKVQTATGPAVSEPIKAYTGPNRRSGDAEPVSPSAVLARPDPLEQPAESVPPDIPSSPQLARQVSSESAKILRDFAATKEAALPSGVDKLERMVVRVGWSMREDLPDGFDEMTARRFPIKFKRWEEMAVLWKQGRLELWGSYSDPFRRLLTRNLQLKHTIVLREISTSLSVFTITDQIFALRCSSDEHLHSRRPGVRNKRHVRHPGTLLFCFRARSPTIAEDWYLRLYKALNGLALSSFEVHFPGIGVRIKLPTTLQGNFDVRSAAHTLARSEKYVSESEGTLEDAELVSKEEVMRRCQELLKTREDWLDLIKLYESRGGKFALAWRKGQVTEWLTIGTSVDGLKRVWDLYVGAIMYQKSLAAHRLEVYPETHYPTAVRLRDGSYMLEPAAIECYISRLRYRNENKRERLYVSTHNGFLLVCRRSHAHAPPFPERHFFAMNQEHYLRTKGRLAHLEHEDKQRLFQQMMSSKGAVRMRDIETIEVQDRCAKCDPDKQDAGRSHAAHQIVVMSYSDGRTLKFEMDPPEAAVELVGRLQALVDYWKIRQEHDARDQALLSLDDSARPMRHTSSASYAPFQARQIEDSEINLSGTYDPLLAETFNFCVIQGCRHNLLKFGRLYFKEGHRDDAFQDRFFFLIHDHLIEFETVKRNRIDKRPIPLVYHRRVRNISLRDAYLMTGESCSTYLARNGTSGGSFDPSKDQSKFARIYRDGLVSVDDAMSCTFALWRQKRKSSVVGGGMGSGLGKDGRVYVFQARSRLERDQWVQALNVTCEKLVRSSREREVKLATFRNIR